MKKVLVFSLLLVGLVYGSSGEDIYKSRCIECHNMQGMMNMKAPPMMMVSKRLKMMTKSKKDFVDFVKDYIQSPSREKGFCMPMAYNRFGVMPAIGKNMNDKERQQIAEWLYNNFDTKFGKSNNMRCGSAKCGSTKNSSMRCGSAKCGAN